MDKAGEVETGRELGGGKHRYNFPGATGSGEGRAGTAAIYARSSRVASDSALASGREVDRGIGENISSL
jgi:hypothetical protein